MTPDLLPCPFCGSPDVGLPVNPECVVVYCRGCGATAPVDGPGGAARWNRRADADRIRLAERERCAKIADAFARANYGGADVDSSPEAVAAAIRAEPREES